MIYYKFPYTEDFNGKFDVYESAFTEIYVPTKKSGEMFCYAELPNPKALENFQQTFGADGDILKFNDPDWPNSNDSYNTHRYRNFTTLRPIY